jgi:hypothetical protein
MRISNLFMVSCVCLSLMGCASVNTHNTPASQPTTPTPTHHKKKNPIEVSVYNNGKNPSSPYTIIGEAKVSNYNRVGIKRQDAVIHDAMRTVAASMGGDAIIDIKRTNKSVMGKVIAYHANTVV